MFCDESKSTVTSSALTEDRGLMDSSKFQDEALSAYTVLAQGTVLARGTASFLRFVLV